MQNKTIEDFKNEVAQESQFADWFGLCEWRKHNNLGEPDKFMTIAIERYTAYKMQMSAIEPPRNQLRPVTFSSYENKAWVTREGRFHAWGASFEEFESGPANYTIAIIEGEDGKIYEALPSHLTFLD